MTPIDYIIVKVNTRANTETESGIIYRIQGANEAQEAVEYGIVEHIPDGCTIPIGSKLYFHRNITIMNSGFNLEKDLYVVPYSDTSNMTFGYVKDGVFNITGDYSFLSAIKIENKMVNGIIVPAEKGYDGYEEAMAIMTYAREDLKSSIGKKCYLERRRCYFIEIEGEQYWAAQDRYILADEVTL